MWNHSNVMLQYVCGIGILYMYLYIVYLCTPQFAYKSRRLRYLDHLLCASRLSCLVRGSCGLTSKITKGSNLFKFQRNTLTKLHLANRRAGEGHLTQKKVDVCSEPKSIKKKVAWCSREVVVCLSSLSVCLVLSSSVYSSLV